MIWFTSDTHYWHKNIIQYSKRPFANLTEMHAGLIERWNAVVQPEDVVYHLGDVSFAGKGHTLQVLCQLRGRIRFLRGNHDRQLVLRPGLDEDLGSYHELTYHNQRLVLCHYPLLTWNKGHHGAWMLHGHCHGNLDELNEGTTRLDVGVDSRHAPYAPLSFNDVSAIMMARSYKSVDHHGRKEGSDGVSR